MLTFSNKPRPRGGRWPNRLIWLSLIILLLAAMLIIGSGPTYRLGWLSLGESFSLLRRGAQLALGGAAIAMLSSLVALLCRRWRIMLASLLTATAALALISTPLQMQHIGRSVPPIHDISTDTVNPPAFETLAPARRAAPNAVDYPGEATARQQKRAYPQLDSLILNIPVTEALSAAEITAREQGWEIASVNANQIEATASTRWFGFKDDVIIRLTQAPQGVLIDVRSASRLGKSDLGTNAARIQTYLEALKARVEG
ncbi:DUF1499 domain-containing protein [Halomonas halocynthiae]|uniref:DUF1499 domain-containing protein n=1 Tax=Halomonas halocynthiae TaxID=176290 RepID=UPI0004091D6D|nr:DUF1499 domain-containing protein [Halomonas halocynthiae]